MGRGGARPGAGRPRKHEKRDVVHVEIDRATADKVSELARAAGVTITGGNSQRYIVDLFRELARGDLELVRKS